MPHQISVEQRLLGGGGFGGGFARGLTQNILEGRKEDRLAALLKGDIAGMEGGLPPEMRSQIPTEESQGGLANLLSAIGIGGRRGPSIEDLIMQRAKIERQVQIYKQQVAESKLVYDEVVRTKPELTEQTKKQLIDRAFGPVKLLLPGAFEQIDRANAEKKRQDLSRQSFADLYTKGVRIGSVAGEGEETTTDIFRDPTQRELLGAAAGVPSLMDEVLKAQIRPPEKPHFFSPGPGTPGFAVDPGTLQATPIPGTERLETSPAPTLERDLNAEADRLGIPPEERFEWKQRQREKAAGGRAGAVAGERPIEGTAATAIISLKSVQRMMQNVRRTFDPKFVGKGFQGSTGGVTAPVRKFFGKMSDTEVGFRRDLADARDALQRARSGAQINEPEYQRLKRLLPNETSEPSIFLADLRSFETELEQIIQDRLNLATTPRKELRGGGSGGPKRERTIDLNR